MTEKDGKFIMTPEEHDEAVELCERLAYSGGLSLRMMAQATRLESWEVYSVEHDIILLKNSRLQELREVIYDIDDTNHELAYMQHTLYEIAYWMQFLIYNREMTEHEVLAVRWYCTYADVDVYKELKIIACYASLPDSEFIHKMHTYIDGMYAHILRHTYDAAD
mgnify:CR=1 FL=1